jgi:type III secretion protein R
MMRFISSPKNWFYLTLLVALFWFSPASIYSEPAPAPTTQENVQTPTTPQKRRPAPRNTTSIVPRTEQQVDLAQQAAESQIGSDLMSFQRPSLITQATAITLLSLAPFIIMIMSSFLKIVIVLSLLRSALGVQQAPPNQIINGIALMLSLFIMYPTGIKMYDAATNATAKIEAPDSLIAAGSSTYILEIANAAKEPLRDFLKINSSVRHQGLFYRMAYRVMPDNFKDSLKPDDFMIIVPSYITSQLKDAFEIGVLIYIPFFVIDLVTSNILLAMGMMMLSPVTISMPLKLFLLVMLDGWTLLIEGLVNTFR